MKQNNSGDESEGLVIVDDSDDKNYKTEESSKSKDQNEDIVEEDNEEKSEFEYDHVKICKRKHKISILINIINKMISFLNESLIQLLNMRILNQNYIYLLSKEKVQEI